uniref:Ig-like domain-containing protein n=1 Tax=Xenopus tropicalis TaxID=8364 RepID=A0A803K275_XENTR
MIVAISQAESPVQNEFINNRSVSIQLHRVQISDTGMYICEVTLGLNKTLQGHWNGTFLNVVVPCVVISVGYVPILRLCGGVIVGTLILFAVYFSCRTQGMKEAQNSQVQCGPIEEL